MFNLPVATGYTVLLVCILPICAWVCWTDLKFMKIPNIAVMAVAAIWLVVGFLIFPLEPWAWRWVNLVVVLAIGFLLNALANVGAGDAKFAAAAAPFFKPDHLAFILPLFAAFLLGAFFGHRILRAIPAVRAMTPDWVSWQRKDFPMGLALAGTFVAYVAFIAFPPLQMAFFAVMSR
jgi:prepilin peptidase CpaA